MRIGRTVAFLCALLWSSSQLHADARLAIIIDDIGYNQSQSERAARLNGAFTLSVLPFTPHGISTAQLAHQQGKELMLHAPMSNLKNMPLGLGGLVTGMDKTAFITTLRKDLDNIPYIKGVNNHMGSRLTQEPEPMQWLMDELNSRKLYFVDSRTSAQTRAFDIARASKVPSLKRDVFLDDVEETSAIEQQLKRALQLARQHGSAVAIGHPYPTTLSVLEQIQPLLDQEQVQLVYASQLLPKSLAISAPEPSTNGSSYCPVPRTFLLDDLQTNVDLYDITDMMLSGFFGY